MAGSLLLMNSHRCHLMFKEETMAGLEQAIAG
jgi:hypothetical protein